MASPLRPDSLVAYCGIDFGTTCSAISFRMLQPGKWNGPAVSFDGGEPDQGLGLTPHTPTCITSAADGGQPLWGWQANLDEEAFRWFKLALAHPEDLGTDFQTSAALEDARRTRLARNACPKQVAADYLRALWDSSLRRAADYLNTPVARLARATFHVVMGVPASWPPDAQLRLREAVAKAGIPGPRSHPQSTLEFLSEAEASSLAVLGPEDDSWLNVGDVITVCDCGGGTADAISYKFHSRNPLALQECVPGSSHLAGPVLFEDEFWELVASKITPGAAPTMRAGITKPNLRRYFHEVWENKIKTVFNEAWPGYPTPVPFEFMNPADRRRRLVEGPPSITFTHEEIKALFDPAVSKITELLRAQVDAVVRATNELPKAVILCGGFSNSPFVRSRVASSLLQCQQSYNSRHIRGTIGLLHDAGQFAASRGIKAVAHGCMRHAWNKHSGTASSIRVTSYLARASYGFALAHRESDGEINGGGGSGSSPPFLGFIAQGERLHIEVPKRVPVDLARVRFAAAPGGGGPRGDVCLAIFRGSELDMSQGRGTKYCTIFLTGPVAAAIDAAGQPVEIAAVAGSAASSVLFHVYVGGRLLEQGPHVNICYEQTWLWW